ncbi:MAG: hypothetical protein P8020_21640 [Acidobacteriota bacterium]|jgi:hypothetical protein
MYRIFAVELRGPFAQKDLKRWRAWNPQAGPRARFFYVVIKTGDLPEIEDLKRSNVQTLKRYAHGILPTHAKRTKRGGALYSQELMIRNLRAKGHVVANPPPPRTFSVYVFALDPKVGRRSGVRKLNPEADPAKPVVYVGQTGKSPQERFQEHQAGIRSGKYYDPDDCLHLLPELYEGLNRMTELQSLRTERRLAYQLRREGHTVLGGH